MKICRLCGIGIGELNSVPKEWNRGNICKICNKYYGREHSNKHYHEKVDKASRCVEPNKLFCVECGKGFWTTNNKKITCGKDCAKIRKTKLDNLYKEKIKLKKQKIKLKG